MGSMKTHSKFGLVLVLLLSVPITIKASLAQDGYELCEHTVQKWASSSLGPDFKNDKHALRDLLFFLHIPRTGGRSYLHCFLKKLYSNSQKCPQSYDEIRFNTRRPNCQLLSTHDDYSMISKLPKEKTSVVTILRSPIDRVFSTYEFSVEVAARFLIHPNLASVARMAHQMLRKKAGVSTLNIWPWKYLVPWMREDLFARRDARKLRDQSFIGSYNSYDLEDILMPLHEYINDPIARDIVHNGATFQKRLDDMLYVGLTENHKESATMFANVVGTQVIAQHTTSSSTTDFAEPSFMVPNTKTDANHHQGNDTSRKPNKVSSIGKDGTTSENLTAGKLMEAYESCVSSLRSSQSERRVNSLKRISPANFTKEARRQVPEALIREIESLNSLDVELYKHAQSIFAKQQERLKSSFTGNADTNFYNPLKFLMFAMAGLMLLLFTFIFINARRRTFKVKL